MLDKVIALILMIGAVAMSGWIIYDVNIGKLEQYNLSYLMFVWLTFIIAQKDRK